MTSAIWREVGDHVFVRRYSTWGAEPFDQNVGVVLGSDGVVIIDTRASHRLADEVLADLRRLSRAPLAAVINTHHHWDHTFGNARFAPVPIWGHVRCAERVRDEGEAMRQRVAAQAPEYADELGEVVLTPPDRTFDESALLDLGNRQLELRYLGHGHTDNDIVISVPDAATLFVGDLLENNAPPGFGDAFPLAWAETAVKLLGYDAAAVVPGHGTVGDAALARRGADELRAMADLAQQVLGGLIGPEEVVSRAPYPEATARLAIERARLEISAPKMAR